MTVRHDLEIGKWYQTEDGQLVKVIAVDSDDETIEIQCLDDTVEEFELDTWDEMNPEPVNSPDYLASQSNGIVNSDTWSSPPTLSEILHHLD